jgi:hypothetical protein
MTMSSRSRIHSWGGLLAALLCILALGTPASAHPRRGKKGPNADVDAILAARADRKGSSRVIVTFAPGRDGSDEVKKAGGLLRRRLDIINGVAAELPNKEIFKLAHHPDVFSIHFDRPIGAAMNA